MLSFLFFRLAMFTIPEFFKNISRHRYILAAHNICFTNPIYTTWVLHSIFPFFNLFLECFHLVGAFHVSVSVKVDLPPHTNINDG